MFSYRNNVTLLCNILLSLNEIYINSIEYIVIFLQEIYSDFHQIENEICMIQLVLCELNLIKNTLKNVLKAYCYDSSFEFFIII